MPDKVQVEHVYKVFGPSPQEAIRFLRDGVNKDDLQRETGNVVGVDDASFVVGQGEVFMVMGLSGSGKSTLVRCINRLIEPTSGHVYVDGEDITGYNGEQLRALRRNKMSMVFQHFALFPHKSVVENVEYGLKVRKVGAKERRERALETLGLVGLREWASYAPDNLSGGMQQRVGLARALATDPDILLMDEAFSALDPLIRRDMQDELIDLQRRVQKTIIFITHDLNEALKLGDHIAVMKDGRIVQIGTPEEIVSGPANDYVAAFTQEVDRGRVFTVASIMKPCEALVQGRDTVRTAIFRMREPGLNALYVVDNDDRALGLITEPDIARAVQEGVRDLAQVTRQDFPRIERSAPLVDTYGLCAAGLPIAVVDERGIMVGIVEPLDVLAHLTVEPPSPAPETQERANTQQHIVAEAGAESA